MSEAAQALPDFRNDLIIFHQAWPGNRASQNVQPFTGLPVMDIAAADGVS